MITLSDYQLVKMQEQLKAIKIIIELIDEHPEKDIQDFKKILKLFIERNEMRCH